jgi:formylglycine-generating enzyme required for sulfatase activity
MGAVSGDSNALTDESPQHAVTISKDFLLLRSETTQDQFVAVYGSNPSNFTGDSNRPVEQVLWQTAYSFCDKLSQLESVATGTYRLPTEAEWEYAARAGTTSILYGAIDSIAWYSGNSSSTTHPVKQKVPNAWNLYDMLGNVGEWNLDWYAGYGAGSATDPTGPGTGSIRVFRGGALNYGASSVRTSQRGGLGPGSSNSNIGFRPLRSLP